MGPHHVAQTKLALDPFENCLCKMKSEILRKVVYMATLYSYGGSVYYFGLLKGHWKKGVMRSSVLTLLKLKLSFLITCYPYLTY